MESTSTLSHEKMQAQLSSVELLTGMFPEPDELDVPPETLRWTKALSDWCSGAQSVECPPGLPSELPLALSLVVGGDSQPADGRRILLNISVPMRCADEDADSLQPPPLRYFLRQPDWISKSQLLAFSALMPQDDVFEAIEWIRDEAQVCLIAKPQKVIQGAQVPPESLVRVWFYFPSLSTREKRDDMVNFAPAYQLTGFVLAGKPGVLCLEGTTTSIDAYMKYIKTHSWGDIPSYQKKVSERYREIRSEGGEALGIRRVFGGMAEITGVLGDRGGARANRGDMKALENWLKGKGLGNAFEKVIF